MQKRELLPEQQVIVKKFWKEALSPQGALHKAERLCSHLAQHITECERLGIPPQRSMIEDHVRDATDAVLAFKGNIDDAYLAVDKRAIEAIMLEVKNWPRPESGQRHYFNSSFKAEPSAPAEPAVTAEHTEAEDGHPPEKAITPS